MNGVPDIRYDVASVLNRGHRDYQEDAIATDFPMGEEFGYAVLSDGMGGHAAGDVASKIVVTEVFSELKFQTSDIQGLEANMGHVLRSAAVSANECMSAHASNNPQTAGMGATLVAPVFIRDCLFWISIGDSPLFLMRKGRLRQLNEDHSLGPHIDYMVRSGMMPEDIGRNHPDRNALTSVLIGETIERIDCPDRPFRLRSGDVLIVASDGLQFLSNGQITRVVEEHAADGSQAIAENLLEELRDLDDPEQDNVCFSVISIDMPTVAEDDQNDYAPEFEPRKARGARATTRPIKPEEMPAMELPAAAVVAQTNGHSEALELTTGEEVFHSSHANGHGNGRSDEKNGANPSDTTGLDETGVAETGAADKRGFEMGLDEMDESDFEDRFASYDAADNASDNDSDAPIFLRRRWLANDGPA